MVSKTGCFGEGRSQGKMSESRADCAATTSVIAPCPVTKGPKGTSSWERTQRKRGLGSISTYFNQVLFFFIFSHLNRPQLLPENPQKTLKTVAEASNIGGHVAGKLHLFLFSEVWKETFHWIKRIRQSSWVKGFLWSLVFSCYLCIWYAFVFNNAHRGRETGWTHSPNKLRQCGQDVAGRVLSVQARNITLKHFGTRQ